MPVIVCVGTDLVSGDCLGPLVGRMLIDRNAPTYVYGTFSYLVNAKNVNGVNRFVRESHKGRKILAIDSCVGSREEIGKITVQNSGIYPAAASGKDFPVLGDLSITAVTTDSRPDRKAFSTVRLGFIFDMAKVIADSVLSALSYSTPYYRTVN